jgi:hypothetical protein
MTYLFLKAKNVKGMVKINSVFLFFKNKYTFKSKKKSDVWEALASF